MSAQRNHIDRVILILVLFLMAASTVVVYSASSMWVMENSRLSGLVYKHILKILAGIAAVFIGMQIDYQRYYRFTKIAIIGAVGLLVLTLLMNVMVKGASRWIMYGGFSLQPSEVAKFALMFHLSALLVAKREKLDDLKTGFMPMMIWIGAVVVLVMLQPNFSTGTIIFVLGMILLFVGGVRWKHLLLTGGSLLPFAVVYMVSRSYRLNRLIAYYEFLKGNFNGDRSLYQLLQGVIGFGTGGFFGVGMGASKQRDLFLPEAYGDFIFSIIGEEYGFIGTIVIVAVFATIFVRGLRIARNAPDEFGRFLAIGITSTISLYALGNAIVAVGMMPTTGLPMPFVSYGGSAIIFSGFAVGVLLNISSQTDLHPREIPVEETDVPEREPLVGKVM